jgi:hypothetical protein
MTQAISLRLPICTVALAVILFAPLGRTEPAPPAVAAKPLTTPEDRELIETLVKHNLANYEKIKSYRVEFETSGGGKTNAPLPNGTVAKEEKTSGSGYYLRRGGWYRFDYRSACEVPDRNFKQKNHRMAVLNDSQYIVIWDFEGSASAKCYDHYSLADRSLDEIKAENSANPPQPLLYGFAGEYPYNITERLAVWPELTTWTVTEEQSATEHLYRVTAEAKDRDRRTMTFDANKGYLITSVQMDDLKGTKQLDLTIVPAQFGDVWVPQQIDEIDNVNGRFFHLRATATEVNKTFADTEFNMKRFEFKLDGVRMTQHQPGVEEPVVVLFREGQWIPEKYVKMYSERVNK